jgi:hypothetical protein
LCESERRTGLIEISPALIIGAADDSGTLNRGTDPNLDYGKSIMGGGSIYNGLGFK